MGTVQARSTIVKNKILESVGLKKRSVSRSMVSLQICFPMNG